jgi:integrase
VIQPDLYHRAVDEVTPLEVKRLVNAIEQRGYSGSTVSTILIVVKSVFSYAVLAGDIEVSPATEVNKSRNLPKTIRTALTEEQERKVEQYRGCDYLLGLLLLYTGLRKGEAMALTWQDIDRAAGVIHVTKKVNYVSSPPTIDSFLKSQNGRRDVPILAPLAAALPDNKIGLVFPGKNGTVITKHQLEVKWKHYCEAVGIVGATPHQFRHSFATVCYEAGVDAMSAAAMMGDTAEVVSGIYTELRKAHHDESADRVSAYLEMRAAERAAQ